MTHGLTRLRRELEGRRLSSLRSTLGLAVPYAVIRSLASETTDGAPPHMEKSPSLGARGPSPSSAT
jgi:hypothetical protein